MHQPLRAERVGEGPVKVLGGRLDPRQRDRRARGDRAAAARDAARGRRAVARRHGQPRRRPRAARARTPAASTSTATSAAAGRGGGRAFDTYFPGRRAFSEPESRAVRRLVRRLHPAVTVWYHQHMRLVNLSDGVDRRGGPRLRAPRRAARAAAAALPRHRHRLAEPHVPGHERVRGRAARRPAQRRLRRAGTPRAVLAAATRAPPPRRPRGRASSGAASRSAPPAAPRPAPTPSATTARAPTALATRR